MFIYLSIYFTTGEVVGANPSNELIGGVVAVVWNDHL
jgi:hypothetical protein